MHSSKAVDILSSLERLGARKTKFNRTDLISTVESSFTLNFILATTLKDNKNIFLEIIN